VVTATFVADAMLLVEAVGATKLHVRGSLTSDGVNMADRVLLDEELAPTTALVTEVEWVVEVVLAEEDLGNATGPGVKKGTRGLVNVSTMELAVHGAVTIIVTVSLAGNNLVTRL
jgi:hypothetical protein